MVELGQSRSGALDIDVDKLLERDGVTVVEADGQDGELRPPCNLHSHRMLFYDWLIECRVESLLSLLFKLIESRVEPAEKAF